MRQDDIELLSRVLPPLLHGLEALAFTARYFHPPALADVIEAIGAPERHWREARAAFAAWPDLLQPMGERIDAAGGAMMAGVTGLREAAETPDSVMRGYRALRELPRALEALYPLAGILGPVHRFFLDPGFGEDAALDARFAASVRRDDIGVIPFGDERGRFWLYVPETYAPEAPAPLVMALHGGSGEGRSFLWSWLRAARSRGAIVIAPSSLGRTWALTDEDIDTPNLHEILALVRSRWSIDERRLLLTGMSDGGTFCYVSGLEAASPFTHLAPIASSFHPMLAAMADPGRLRGLPIHIVHGGLDWMFPAGMARAAAQALSTAGADVVHREIPDLSHVYPGEMNGPILDWMAATAAA